MQIKVLGAARQLHNQRTISRMIVHNEVEHRRGQQTLAELETGPRGERPLFIRPGLSRRAEVPAEGNKSAPRFNLSNGLSLFTLLYAPLTVSLASASRLVSPPLSIAFLSRIFLSIPSSRTTRSTSSIIARLERSLCNRSTRAPWILITVAGILRAD